MQHTKLLRNCFRINIQQTFCWRSRDILVVLKNFSIKHTKNWDSLFIRTYQIFPTRQNIHSSTLCLSSAKDRKWEMFQEKLNCPLAFFCKTFGIFCKILGFCCKWIVVEFFEVLVNFAKCMDASQKFLMHALWVFHILSKQMPARIDATWKTFMFFRLGLLGRFSVYMKTQSHFILFYGQTRLLLVILLLKSEHKQEIFLFCSICCEW